MKLPDCILDFLPCISGGVTGIGVAATVQIANTFVLSEFTAALGVIFSIGAGVIVALVIGYCYVKQYRRIFL